MFFSFFFFPSETPWSLVLQGSLNSSWRWGLCGRQAGCRAGRRLGAGRWIETRSGIWTSLTLCCFFSYPLGQCQQLEEPGKSERCELWEQPTPTGEGEKKKIKKEASVYITAKVSVCIISYKSAWLPKGEEKSVPRLRSASLKRTSPVVITVNIILSYLSEYYELMFYWGVELPAAYIRLILVTSVLARKIININNICNKINGVRRML